jgi:hypothetical protein
MKKFIGILALVSMFSFVLIGCSKPAEGDTAPAPDSSKAEPAKTDTSTATPTDK